MIGRLKWLVLILMSFGLMGLYFEGEGFSAVLTITVAVLTRPSSPGNTCDTLPIFHVLSRGVSSNTITRSPCLTLGKVWCHF